MIIRYELKNEHARPPSKAHETDAGSDLASCEAVVIPNGQTRVVNTGVAIELMPGYEAQVRPRSGLSKRGVIVGFGTVDADYRGEIGVIVHNISGRDFEVSAGARIAQLVVAPVPAISWRAASSPLNITVRGESGFGSSGGV